MGFAEAVKGHVSELILGCPFQRPCFNQQHQHSCRRESIRILFTPYLLGLRMRLHGRLKAKTGNCYQLQVNTQTSKEKQQVQKYGWDERATCVRTASESLALVSSTGKHLWQYNEMTGTEA